MRQSDSEILAHAAAEIQVEGGFPLATPKDNLMASFIDRDRGAFDRRWAGYGEIERFTRPGMPDWD
jgi:hypothetical protein